MMKAATMRKKAAMAYARLPPRECREVRGVDAGRFRLLLRERALIGTLRRTFLVWPHRTLS